MLYFSLYWQKEVNNQKVARIWDWAIKEIELRCEMKIARVENRKIEQKNQLPIKAGAR